MKNNMNIFKTLSHFTEEQTNFAFFFLTCFLDYANKIYSE